MLVGGQLSLFIFRSPGKKPSQGFSALVVRI